MVAPGHLPAAAVTRVAAADERCGSSVRWTDELSGKFSDRVLKPCGVDFEWYNMELNNAVETVVVHHRGVNNKVRLRGVVNVFGGGGGGGGGGSGGEGNLDDDDYYSRAAVLDLSPCNIWTPDPRSLYFSSFARYDQFRDMALRWGAEYVVCKAVIELVFLPTDGFERRLVSTLKT